MKGQYDPISSPTDHDLNDEIDIADETPTSPDKNVYRLATFPSISTLRTSDYDTLKSKDGRVGSYASLVSHDASAAKEYKFGPFRIPSGWRFAVYGCMMSCVISFWINLLLTIIVVAKYGVDSSGRLTLFHGDCEKTKTINTWLHIFINAMSTILLSSSNYVQQVLCAVTREEVDAAHQGRRRSRWADIGVPSMFNICLVDNKRVLLWYLLMFSSLPLHLFYNSAVFSSTTTFAFPLVAVNEAWVTAAKADTSMKENPIGALDYAEHNETQYFGMADTGSGISDYRVTISNGHYPSMVNFSDDYLRTQFKDGLFTELTPVECIRAYAQNYVVNRGGLLLVLDVPTDGTNTTNATEPIVFDRAASWTGSSFCEFDRYAWICDQTGKNTCGSSARGYNLTSGRPWSWDPKRCDSQVDAIIRDNATNWRPTQQEYHVKRCLSQKVQQQCKVQASIHLMAVVLFLNLAKAVIMFLAIRWMKGIPLLTLGDAIASFLERPDPYSKDACLLTRKEATHEMIWLGKLTDRPRIYNGRKRRWHAGSGIFRQILIVVLLVIALGVIGFLYGWGITFIRESGFSSSLSDQWNMGIGTVNPATIITFTDMPSSGAAGLVWSAFIANVPQLILSLIYFTYNGILTAYFLGAEWQTYFTSRKGLRVSDAPRGEQRTTYFLALPYRAAIPLMVASGILHWLVSQSIFLVSIETLIWDAYSEWQEGKSAYVPATQYDYVGMSSGISPNVLTCGFSPIPMIFVMVIAGLMILSLIVLGAKKYEASMPVASSNSLAIAAACHVPTAEFECTNVALKKVQWGVVEEKNNEGVGHCCFSSLYVEQPGNGQMYA